MTISSFSEKFLIWACSGVSKSAHFSKMGHFGEKNAGFIRFWGYVILSEIDGCGSTNFRLDFSDLGMLLLFRKVGWGWVWFSSNQVCLDLRFWWWWLSTTNSGYEKWVVNLGFTYNPGGIWRRWSIFWWDVKNRGMSGDTYLFRRSPSIDRLGPDLSNLTLIWTFRDSESRWVGGNSSIVRLWGGGENPFLAWF